MVEMSDGRTLIINNLALSSWCHKLMVLDPPGSLLAEVRQILLDFFWEGREHCVPQRLIFLPKEEAASKRAGVQTLFYTKASDSPKGSSVETFSLAHPAAFKFFWSGFV